MKSITYTLFLKHLFCLFLFSATTQLAFTQTTLEEFGQNRVKYKTFNWSFFESENFTTYFYMGGQDIGQFTIKYAEEVLKDIEDKLEYRLNGKIDLLVYNNIMDANQTNIGIGREQYNIGGTTQIIDNKVFLYFDGNHQNLAAQIRKGIAQVIMENMLFGGNVQEVLQNSILLNLPDWYTLGLISYIGEEWNSDFDDRLRDGILSGRYENINRLTRDEVRFAGHAVWQYIAENYGENAISNLLYITRINRNMESGFLFVIGKPVNEALREWYNYNLSRFAEDAQRRSLPDAESKIDKRKQKKWHHYQPRLHPDGNKVAYVTNQKGRFRVHIYDIENDQTRTIYRAGFRTISQLTDYSFPILSWSPDGSLLVFMEERRGRVYLHFYDTESNSRERRVIPNFQKIRHISFTDDPRTLLLSAVTAAQSNIYTYHILSGRIRQITNDFYNDLQPAYIESNNRRGILFLSNRKGTELKEQRIDSILPTGKLNLFFYDLDKDDNTVIQFTHQKHYNDFRPANLDSMHFAYISETNGIRNLFKGYIDSTFSHYDTTYFFPDSIVVNPEYDIQLLEEEGFWNPDSMITERKFKDTAYLKAVTDYSFGVIDYDVQPASGKVLQMFRQDGTFNFYVKEIDEVFHHNLDLQLYNTSFREFQNQQIEQQRQREIYDRIEQEMLEESGETLQTPRPKYPEYFFQGPHHHPSDTIFDETAERTRSTDYLFAIEDDMADDIFQLTRVLPYRLKFSHDYVQTQLDNSVMINRYQKYAEADPAFNNPSLSILMSIGVSDIFEDYRIIGGFRFPTNFNSSEYFLTFENLKDRLDKKFLYYRKSDSKVYGRGEVVPFTDVEVTAFNLPVEVQFITNYFQFGLTYPLDVTKSFRGYLGYRNERAIYKSRDNLSRSLPNYRENWLIARLEFVHDNTIPLGINLRHGTRYKVYAEIHKEAILRNDTILGDFAMDYPWFNNAYLGVIGGDFRHYQRLHRQIIWANRFAFASSYGNNRLVYFLGGVDNAFLPRFNNDMPVSPDGNFAFQTLATNMRGFPQNIRNGSNFAVINSELRVPVFSYLIQNPIRSEFVRNFQLIGFTDLGTAWTGINPYDQDNPLFNEVIGDVPIEIEVEYFRNPIVMGYGFGARTTIFGYFVRLDLAWGLDSGEVSDPIWHFSLSLDF